MKKFYAVSGETFKCLLMMTNTKKGKEIRKYFIKTESLASTMNRYLTEFHKKQLEQKSLELKHQQSCNIVLQNYVTNVKQRLRKEIIYIATTKSYANQNNFKVGGCSNRKLLKKRLSTYNTGRPDADKYYFCYIEETSSYKHLERRIKELLGEFRDNKNREMYVMHFTSLKLFVNLLKNNYDEEIQEFNELIKKLLTDFSKTLNADIVQRKDFENFAREKKYKFKSRELWKQLKRLFEPTQKVLAIKY